MIDNQLIITVDRDSWVPAAEQIRTAVTSLVQAGMLVAGHPLPTVRQLAGDLGLAAGTVARAYRTLESDGIIETHGRRGSFIAASSRTRPLADDRRLAELGARYLAEARGLGATAEQALRAVHRLVSD
ncbi:MAG: GntR family transcriptional regulator [Jatrophihabitantaceae bacterium]